MPSIGMGRDTGRQLDTAAVRINESQSEAATRLLESLRFLRDPNSGIFQKRKRTPHGAFVRHRIGDVMQASRMVPMPMQNQNELFWRCAAKKNRIISLVNLIQ